MKVLITGAGGQLGRTLLATAPPHAAATGLRANELDVTDRAAVAKAVAELRPDFIFNAAAYTAVDRAESEEARAHAVNATAVGHLAEAADLVGAKLVHVSTDFVFDGESGRPYSVDAAPRPLNAYGRTKLAGEAAAGPAALIVRTAWVYAASGRNFVKTMLGAMNERDEVRVVADQVGTPTSARSLASALWKLAALDANGIHHYTDSGMASWYDFAVAIQEEALALGLITARTSVVPIATEDYPTPAKRPPCSVLDKRATFGALGRAAPHWRSNLREVLTEIARNG